MALRNWLRSIWDALEKSYDEWEKEELQFRREHPELVKFRPGPRWPY